MERVVAKQTKPAKPALILPENFRQRAGTSTFEQIYWDVESKLAEAMNWGGHRCAIIIVNAIVADYGNDELKAQWDASPWKALAIDGHSDRVLACANDTDAAYKWAYTVCATKGADAKRYVQTWVPAPDEAIERSAVVMDFGDQAAQLNQIADRIMMLQVNGAGYRAPNAVPRIRRLNLQEAVHWLDAVPADPFLEPDEPEDVLDLLVNNL
jgi:hypothetical protein